MTPSSARNSDLAHTPMLMSNGRPRDLKSARSVQALCEDPYIATASELSSLDMVVSFVLHKCCVA